MDKRSDKVVHIGEDWPEKRVNEVLVQNYGYDLFDFAFSLAVVLRNNPPFRFYEIWKLKNISFGQLEQYEFKVKSLERLKNSIIKRLESHLEDIGYWRAVTEGKENRLFPSNHVEKARLRRDGRLIREEKRRLVIEIYKLENTIQTIDAEISHYRNLFKLFGKRRRGRHALPKNIIFSLWSYAMKRRRNIELDSIVDLFNWFLNKIRNTSYGKSLEKSVTEESVARRTRGYPSAEEISRFKRFFEKELRGDFREIFGHNYKEMPSIKKPKTLQIRFENDEPKFFKIEEDAHIRIPLIIFPR